MFPKLDEIDNLKFKKNQEFVHLQSAYFSGRLLY